MLEVRQPAAQVVPVPSKPYRLWDVDSIFELDPPRWLLDYVIPEKGSCLLYGPTNVGKSLVALDWAFRMASGWDWMGRAGTGKPISVLYVYSEGGHDLQLRYQAWVEAHKHFRPDLLEDNLHFIGLDEEITLRWHPDAEEPPEGVRRLWATVDAKQEGQRKYDLVVFDPAQEVWRGMNGNNDQEVAMAWRVVKDLQRMHDAAAVIVHHTRKEGDTFRGATTWLDLADTGFVVTDEGNNLVRVTNSKNRFAEKGHSVLMERRKQVIDHKAKLLGAESVVLVRGYTKLDQGSPERRAIMDQLEAEGSALLSTLVKETGIAKTTMSRLLGSMIEEGLIERDGNTREYSVVEADDVEVIE